MGHHMSKTTNTRPLYVRMNDPLDRKVQRLEVHDHATGSCSLPASSQYAATEYAYTNCYYLASVPGFSGCTCRACTSASHGYRAERRRSRHEARTEMRLLATGVIDR
jgi:hypothetical protein